MDKSKEKKGKKRKQATNSYMCIFIILSLLHLSNMNASYLILSDLNTSPTRTRQSFLVFFLGLDNSIYHMMCATSFFFFLSFRFYQLFYTHSPTHSFAF